MPRSNRPHPVEAEIFRHGVFREGMKAGNGYRVTMRVVWLELQPELKMTALIAKVRQKNMDRPKPLVPNLFVSNPCC